MLGINRKLQMKHSFKGHKGFIKVLKVIKRQKQLSIYVPDSHFGLENRKHILSTPFLLSFYGLKNDVSHNSSTFKVLNLHKTTTNGGGDEIPNYVKK